MNDIAKDFLKGAPLLHSFPKYGVGQKIICKRLKGQNERGVEHWFWIDKISDITSYRYGVIWEDEDPRFIYKIDGVLELDECQIKKCFDLYKY